LIVKLSRPSKSKPKVASNAPRRGRQLVNRLQKIALGEMREMGVCGLLVYYSDYKCSHSERSALIDGPIRSGYPTSRGASPAKACGTKGADLRPNFHWEREAREAAVLVRQPLRLGSNSLRKINPKLSARRQRNSSESDIETMGTLN
jgi:hypothetical protein